MKPVVITLSGKKGSGKNTLASFIAEYFSDHCSVETVAEYAFADLLKEFCINVLGLERKQCYGSDEEKNTPTEYKWEDTPLFAYYPLSDKMGEPTGPMTGREVMQAFGTECVRSWFGNVWAKATLRQICNQNPALAVITDNRFPSEVDVVLEYSRGYIIRLTREPFEKDNHPSETALDDFDWNREKCYVLDNANLSKEEQAQAIIPILKNIFRQEFSK